MFSGRKAGPITRKRSRKTNVDLSEEIDHSAGALSEDQLAQRYKAEANAMNAAAPTAQSMNERESVSTEPTASAAPAGRGLLAPSEAVLEANKRTKRKATFTPSVSFKGQGKVAKLKPDTTPGSGSQARPIPIVRMLEQTVEVERA